MANGPYVVSGGVPLRSKTPIVSENGEPMAWLTGPVTDRGAGYALCRCGGSANKPYCDGTHSSNGFDGTESASTQSYAQSSTELGGTGLTIRDDRSLCEHAGFCGNRVTNVWDMAAETGDSVVRAQAMAMIERCPSGALTYEVDGQAVEPSLPVEIATVPDGPLYVTGSIAVQRADRQGFEARNRMTLCRCGASKNKPLCDGSHADAGFQAP
ncbi:MAG: CDGSH iron-sulfur domain-containing protein, partial [Acidimicrobiia bacterium]|nr:CDGSH iron-sulfur domain-containing protein [Acidimicrobiia bacterium]